MAPGWGKTSGTGGTLGRGRRQVARLDAGAPVCWGNVCGPHLWGGFGAAEASGLNSRLRELNPGI